MGGKALKNTFTRRYGLGEYNSVCSIVDQMIQNHIPADQHSFVKELTEKDSFGDIDIVIDGDPTSVYRAVRSIMPDSEIAARVDAQTGRVSSPHMSFAVDQLQVDFIFTEKEDFDFHSEFLSYGDLNQFTSMMAKRCGFKMGPSGLNYILMDNTNKVDLINASKDFTKVMDFLGFDSDRFKEGFSDNAQVMDYIAHSKYFDPDFYVHSSFSGKSKRSIKDRPAQQDMARFCQSLSGSGYSNPFPGKSFFLDKAFDVFDGFKGHYNDALEQYRIRESNKAKFNGSVVSELTGLSGQNLGLFMESYKMSFSDMDFQDYLTSNTKEKIKNDISEYFHSQKNRFDNFSIR